MAANCPKCGRLNSEQTGKCIYCGAELPKTPKEVGLAEKERSVHPGDEKPPGAVSKERIFLVLSPVTGRPSDSMARALAEVMNWDVYSAKLKLRNPAPFILAAGDDARKVQDLVQRLGEIGIDSYLIKESGLSRLEKKQVARSVLTEESGLVFRLEDRSQRVINLSDLFLLVRGRIRLSGGMEKKVGNFDLSAMDLDREKIFDLMVKRRRDRKKSKIEFGSLTAGETGTEVELFDLYGKNDHTAVRVIESEFDFSGLFGPGFQARLLGLKKMVDLLREKSAGLIVDESFNRIGYTYREKPVDQKRSLSLVREGRTKSREKLHSSQALFTGHSSLIYLHYLRQKVSAQKQGPAL